MTVEPSEADRQRAEVLRAAWSGRSWDFRVARGGLATMVRPVGRLLGAALVTVLAFGQAMSEARARADK